MIDTILTLPLELMTLTVLVGAGIWRIYTSMQSATINKSTPRTYDMRLDGQRLSLQTAPL